VQPRYALLGKNVKLAPLDPSDAPLYAQWVNSPELKPFLNRPWEITEEEERRRLHTLIHADNAVGFALRMKENGALIGRSAIWNIHAVNRSGLFTIFIGDRSRWSKGLGTEATALTSIYAMDELKLHRLELECFVYNERAMKTYEKLGFKREGVRKEARLHEGRFHDAIQMAILESDWLNGTGTRMREHLDSAGVRAAPGGRAR